MPCWCCASVGDSLHFCLCSGNVPAGHHDAAGQSQSEGDVRQEQACHRHSRDWHAGHQGKKQTQFSHLNQLAVIVIIIAIIMFYQKS